MKFYCLPRPVLMACNAILWGAPGINILMTGISTWQAGAFRWYVIAALAIIILISFHMMFSAIVRKNITRLRAMPEKRIAIWKMMPLRTWLVMIFMMGLGITLKHTGIAPAFFIAFFYCGLGTALCEAGIRYISAAVSPDR